MTEKTIFLLNSLIMLVIVALYTCYYTYTTIFYYIHTTIFTLE